MIGSIRTHTKHFVTMKAVIEASRTPQLDRRDFSRRPETEPSVAGALVAKQPHSYPPSGVNAVAITSSGGSVATGTTGSPRARRRLDQRADHRSAQAGGRGRRQRAAGAGTGQRDYLREGCGVQGRAPRNWLTVKPAQAGHHPFLSSPSARTFRWMTPPRLSSEAGVLQGGRLTRVQSTCPRRDRVQSDGRAPAPSPGRVPCLR